MKTKSQQENHVTLPDGTTLTLGKAIELRDRLTNLIKNCNVAKFVFKPQEDFATLEAFPAQVIEVDKKQLFDLQRLAKIGDNLELSILELLNFYSENEALTIFLQPEVLETRESYTKYTLQFANTLKNGQFIYPFVKVLFDSETSRLGIFCRKHKPVTKKAFSILLADTLVAQGSVFIPYGDLPKTYQTNMGMLTYQLRQRLGDGVSIHSTKTEEGVNISANTENSN